MFITSTNNDRVKRLRSLYRDKKTRNEEGVFVCEGQNIVKDIPSFCKIEEMWYSNSAYEKLVDKMPTCEKVYVLPDKIFNSVADTVTPSGVIAVVKKNMPRYDFDVEERIVVLDGLSDVGNIGTIIRTAAANGIKTVILVNSAEPYSPKSVRASMGGVFYVNIIETDKVAIKSLLKNREVVVLDMGGNCIYGYKRKGNIAICVGNEAHGISEELKSLASETVSIPMVKNTVESLNAAISVAIAIFLIK